MSDRAGSFVRQPTGYASFVPKPLPPQPPLVMDAATISLLSRADRALGRLDGITQTLPNPDLFVSMYVKKEALLSSQIEGTQASLEDVLQVQDKQTEDAKEVLNYVDAMNYGLRRLRDDGFPLSLRLLREIHARLLASGRGSTRNPGEFRSTQNWIGSPGSTIESATFVPPAPDDMRIALGDLETFLHAEADLPPLVKIALVHAQFETIHPFLDGNGRMGRLLITFWLCQQEILSQPLLYLSYYFKRNRSEYYKSLMDVRLEGGWEAWVRFFLQGIVEISEEASSSARQIDALRSAATAKVDALGTLASANARKLLDHLFIAPSVTYKHVEEALGVSPPTATQLVSRFCEMGVLEDRMPQAKRGKQFVFREYLDILEQGTQ